MPRVFPQLKLLIFIATMFLLVFCCPGRVLADIDYPEYDPTGGYEESGTLTSVNLLEGKDVASIDSFDYNVSALPATTTLSVQFSQDNSTWVDSDGESEWETLSSGENNIDLSGLSWSGANFYYKMEFTSDGEDTPVLVQITVNYTTPEQTFLAVTDQGRVGIGTSTPEEALHVIGNIKYTGSLMGTSPATIAGAKITGDFEVQGKSILHGNVGIGITEPSQALDIDGNVRAHDFITASRVADVSKNRSALANLGNIAEWRNEDGTINYEAHYAFIGKEITRRVYDKDCTEEEIKRGECRYEEVSETIKGLSMETRVAEMEQMIWELDQKLTVTVDEETGKIIEQDTAKYSLKGSLAQLGLTINQYGELELKTLRTEKLCVGEVCVTEDEFRDVFGGGVGFDGVGEDNQQPTTDNQQQTTDNQSTTTTPATTTPPADHDDDHDNNDDEDTDTDTGTGTGGESDPAKKATSTEYTLTLTADPEEGGTAKGEGKYEKDAEISLEAEAENGWEFIGWTADEGSFDDKNASSTLFTMPEEDVEVTAIFEKEDPAEDEKKDLTCSADNLGLCTTQDECEGADLHWYDEECHAAPEPEEDFEAGEEK